MARREFCLKDDILITYDASTVCFENTVTADSILLKNNGEIIHSNFDSAENEFYQNYLKKIYSSITACRNLDALELA